MSVANDIGAAVVAAIQAINLEVSSGVQLLDANVVQRKRPELAPKEQPPKIFVCVGDEGETDILTPAHKVTEYPVTVVIVTAGGATLEEDTRVRTWRESIREAVGDSRTCFTTLAGWLFTRTTSKAPFDQTGLSKDLVYSGLVFGVRVVESRSV